MKKLMKPQLMPLLMLACGVIGLLVRELLYLVAMDDKGLMAVNHPLEIVLWLLILGVLALVPVVTVRLGGSEAFDVNFPAGIPGAVGCFVMAACVVLTVFMQAPAMGGAMGRIWQVLGMAAGAGLTWVGLCRLDGKKPSFAAHLGLCLFLIVHILSHYQTWSRSPYLQDNLFTILGSVALTLFAYYQMAFDVDLGKRRMLLAMGLLAIFLCTAALNSCGYWMLYLGAVAWVWTNLCSWEVPAVESVEK